MLCEVLQQGFFGSAVHHFSVTPPIATAYRCRSVQSGWVISDPSAVRGLRVGHGRTLSRPVGTPTRPASGLALTPAPGCPAPPPARAWKYVQIYPDRILGNAHSHQSRLYPKKNRYISGRSGMHPERDLTDMSPIHVDAGCLMRQSGNSTLQSRPAKDSNAATSDILSLLSYVNNRAQILAVTISVQSRHPLTQAYSVPHSLFSWLRQGK
jgi:hypothetical protein